MITLEAMRIKIMGLINKDPIYLSFFTPQKVKDMIEDSLDYLSLEASLQGGGWFNGLQTIAMPPAGFEADIPANVAIINQVRYLVNGSYVPLKYDDADGQAQAADNNPTTQYPRTYRVMGRKLFINPAPSERGADRIQLEFTRYPSALTAEDQIIDPEFDNCLQQYLKWRVASMLMATAGRGVSDWKQYEMEWRQQCQNYMQKRNRATTTIKDFC